MQLIGAGVEVFKLHVQVGEFLLDDPLLDEAFGLIEDAGTPTVIHVGSGPVATNSQARSISEPLLARHPRLPVVVAHTGAPEYAEILALAETYEHTRLDTLMVFSGSSTRPRPIPTITYPDWPTSATGCCWAATSRRSPTPTASGSPGSSGRATATRDRGRTGCAGFAGTTASSCSEGDLRLCRAGRSSACLEA